MLRIPETKNCQWVYWNLKAFSPRVKEKPLSRVAQFTNHMVAINPTVPITLIGGKSVTVSRPFFFSVVKATVFDNASVGI